MRVCVVENVEAAMSTLHSGLSGFNKSFRG